MIIFDETDGNTVMQIQLYLKQRFVSKYYLVICLFIFVYISHIFFRLMFSDCNLFPWNNESTLYITKKVHSAILVEFSLKFTGFRKSAKMNMFGETALTPILKFIVVH